MKVLIITNYFYPENIIAAFRMNAFAKYFREAGHDVTVITGGDTTRTEEWEGCTVHYVTDPTYRQFIHHQYAGSLRKWSISRIAKAIEYRLTLHTAYLHEKKMMRLALRLIRDNGGFDCILTTGSYGIDSNGVGLELRRKGVKSYWIADFRDEPKFPDPHRWDINRYVLKNYKKLIQDIFDTSDLLLSVSTPLVDMIRASSAHGNVLEIRNGYDYPEVYRDYFQPVFTMSYLGHLYKDVTPDNWFRAFASLIADGQIPADSRIKIVGNPNPVKVPESIRHNVLLLPAVDHDEAVRISIHESDALVMIYSRKKGRKGVYSGKLLDYLATNKPIISIYDPEDVTGALMTETCAGFAVADDDVEGIRDAVLACYRLWENRLSMPRNWELIRTFHRRHQVGLLLDYLRRTTTLR